MNKRGISPVIATLLLISFAVAIGVVVMTFGKAQVETQAQCPLNIGLKLSVISGQKQICFDSSSNQIKFTIENGANIAVDRLVANIIGTEKAETIEINDAKMEKVGSYVGKVSYNVQESGEIRQIKLTPAITLYDEQQVCIEKALTIEKVPNC